MSHNRQRFLQIKTVGFTLEQRVIKRPVLATARDELVAASLAIKIGTADVRDLMTGLQRIRTYGPPIGMKLAL
jgi:hypothetical protein